MSKAFSSSSHSSLALLEGEWGNRATCRVEGGKHGSPVSLVSPYRVIQTFRNEALFGKRRSFWFYWSKEQLKRVIDLGMPLDLAKVEYGFQKWMEQYKERFIHLSSGNKHVFLLYFNRFCKKYKKRLKNRLRLLDFMVWDIKIELTIDPKKFLNLYDEFIFINRAWNKLRSWIKRRYGEFEFLKVLEVTEKGRPHLHVLISGIRWINQGELSEIWQKYGGGEVVYIKRVYNRNNVKVCRYVLKYVNKSLRMENKRFSALLFASNRRLFGLSEGLRNMINVENKALKQKLGFIYEGMVCRGELEAYLQGKGLILADYLFVEIERSDMYEFPLLFGGDG